MLILSALVAAPLALPKLPDVDFTPDAQTREQRLQSLVRELSASQRSFRELYSSVVCPSSGVRGISRYKQVPTGSNGGYCLIRRNDVHIDISPANPLAVGHAVGDPGFCGFMRNLFRNEPPHTRVLELGSGESTGEFTAASVERASVCALPHCKSRHRVRCRPGPV